MMKLISSPSSHPYAASLVAMRSLSDGHDGGNAAGGGDRDSDPNSDGGGGGGDSTVEGDGPVSFSSMTVGSRPGSGKKL